MTVRKLFDNLRYIGTSVDTKPNFNIEDDSIVMGAEFYETDTKDTYVWDGFGWEKKSINSPQYTVRLENTDAPPTKITYVGEAAPGASVADAVWRIKKITETDHAGLDPDIEVTWCQGSDSFTNVWNGHAGHTYW